MIYLVRHGLDDEGFIGGYSNVGLIDVGKRQINEVGLWLRENIKDINKIYTSDVKRAVESANIINKYLNLEIIKTSKLRELDKGLLNGMKKKEANIKYPDYINVTDIKTKYPSGESMNDLYERIKQLLRNIDKYDNSILITHRGVINMLYVLLNDDKLTMDKEKYDVTHASIHKLENKKIWRVK